MALQEDINKSFGTSNYFDNKDQMRNEINDFIRNQRGKNSAQNAIARNLRRGLRARIGTAENNATGELVKTAKLLGIDDPLAGGGLGMEAGQARKFAEFTLNRNFEEERRRNQELEARTKGIPVAGQQNAGAQPVIGANSALKPEAVASAQQAQNQPQAQANPTIPDWANDVVNDKTFPKGFFNDPKNLAKIQGKSRAEVADMLNKARVARFMSGATARGNALKEEELTKSKLAEYDQIVQRQNQFNSQVDSKVNDALNQAGKSLVKKSIKLPDGTFVDGLSTTDLNALRDAKEIANIVNNIDTTDKGGLAPEYVNNLIVDLQERNTNPFFTYQNVKGKAKIVKAGDMNGKLSSYKSKERVAYDNLVKQSNDYNSPLRTNARNQVISEAQAKQQREAQLTQKREQYRQQSIEQQRMIDAAYALFP